MGREIYPAMTGGMRALRSLEVLSNNLANVNTAGFKADTPVFRLHSPAGAAKYEPNTAEARLAAAWSDLDSEATDFSQGSLETTGNGTDLALNGEGFFAVQSPDGEVFLTRDGSFQVDAEGYLSNRSGLRVVGADKTAIKVPSGEFAVDNVGLIRSGERTVGTIGVFDVPDRSALIKVGGNLWSSETGDPMVPAGAEVRQFHLERSNVEPVRALTELIAVTRYYEAFKNTLNTSGELDRQLHAQVGKLDR
ncbi:MAG: flagellar basal-body rod protein FlgF [Myxococcota bacterium]|nr:flagellar basal-body rod protein FlgF [Myxococcota bacterium]